MKIVIAGGDSQAEFILSMFKGKNNELIVVNGDPNVADLIKKRCRVNVTCGDPWRRYILDEADAFFQGRKTAQDAARIMDSRAALFIAENS